MPAGLMVKAKSNALEVLRSGAKWQEFVLDREVTLTALEERMAFSLDIRSLPASKFDTNEGMSIERIPTMRVHKKEWRYELKAAMSNKTTAFVRNIKTTRLRLSSPPHCVQGEIPISVLESKDSYKAEDDCLALKPLWSVSRCGSVMIWCTTGKRLRSQTMSLSIRANLRPRCPRTFAFGYHSLLVLVTSSSV
ncbi:hypothetical protein R1sor_012942 [Riccia sorocarpa]|uniref:Uncharacterized protein n=1 Tax=Riccia sorocarpa TaxID=122646 RepID=A0ABD3I6C7_9MARC